MEDNGLIHGRVAFSYIQLHKILAVTGIMETVFLRIVNLPIILENIPADKVLPIFLPTSFYAGTLLRN